MPWGNEQADGEVGDVDADPFRIQRLRRRDGRSAAAEWIENNVLSLVRRGRVGQFYQDDLAYPISTIHGDHRLVG